MQYRIRFAHALGLCRLSTTLFFAHIQQTGPLSKLDSVYLAEDELEETSLMSFAGLATSAARSAHHMGTGGFVRKSMGVGLILSGLLLSLVAWFLVSGSQFWLLSPKDKFLAAWRSDLELLQKSNKLPEAWKNIREISLRTDNSPAQNWINDIQPPIQINQNGTYKLDIFIVHWMEGYRYGAIVTYSLMEARNNNNTVFELSRTHKLGVVY